MKHISLSLVLAVFCLVSNTVKAELVAADYSSKVFTFALQYAEGYRPSISGVNAEEQLAIDANIKASFYMTISKGSSDTEAKLTFGLTDFGKTTSFATDDNGVKINNGTWSISGVEDYFSTNSFTTGNQEWVKDNDVLERTSSLKSGQTWADFVDWMDENADFVKIFAHIQSIYVNDTNTGISVNSGETKAYFVYQAPKAPIDPTTPEPATMLIIGLGLAGLGLARRRK